MIEPLTPRALERRLKRHLLKDTQEFFAVCAPGFESVLAKELKGGRGEEEAEGQRGLRTFPSSSSSSSSPLLTQHEARGYLSCKFAA
jgi:hypothetical protein